MGDPTLLLPRALAGARMAVGLLFILYGQFKVFGPAFVPGMLEQIVGRQVEQHQAVGFYQPLLAHVVLPHATFFAYLVAWGELLIGLSLLTGLLVRAAAVAGALHMLSLTLASWGAPGPAAPLWQYFAAQNDHLGLLVLFALFFVGRAGEVAGLDGWLSRKRSKLPQVPAS